MDVTEHRGKIFINPEFKKAHINPNFLSKNAFATVPTAAASDNIAVTSSLPPNIHFNPAFLEKLKQQQQQEQRLQQSENVLVGMNPTPSSSGGVERNPIIKHTKRKLVRASSAIPVSVPATKAPLVAPLVKISKNKLVRTVPSSAVASAQVMTSSAPASKAPGGTRIVEKRYKLVNGSSQIFKLDRRPGAAAAARAISKPKSSIRKYSLIRNNSISPHKVIVTDRRLLKLRRNKTQSKDFAIGNKQTSPFTSQNKKLIMVNINGVLYRSSTNKLQVSSVRSPAAKPVVPNSSSKTTSAASRERCLTIRGTRFLLDQSGTKLRKVPSNVGLEASETKLGRIDIGGLTYMPKMDGTFVRTDVHRTRSYLSVTKQKSIQVLTNKMRKCNVPCPIYRRLGKCTAFLRGKCPKLHDSKHIMICPKFLKGECASEGCLLSHNVTLEKMPVCRFFLEGRCAKNDCPYLHKKVSEKERICEDFLKGYCPLADKCLRRHEFVCPELDRFGVCNRTNCPYPHNRKGDKRKEESAYRKAGKSPVVQKSTTAEVQPCDVPPVSRYYLSNSNSNADDDGAKLSKVQKNQLRKMLDKVDKMKLGHIEGATGDSNNGHEKQNDEEGTIVLSDDNYADVDCGESSEDDDDEDTRPPILKRAKLGPLPSFIPI